MNHCRCSRRFQLDELLDRLDALGIVGVTVRRSPALDELLFIGLR
jgi:hypothetical protein